MKLFAIRDAKSESYDGPRSYPTEAAATRSFGDAINNDAQGYGKFPEDFSLWLIGEWDEHEGVLIGYETPKIVTQGVALVRPKAPPIPA